MTGINVFNKNQYAYSQQHSVRLVQGVLQRKCLIVEGQLQNAINEDMLFLAEKVIFVGLLLGRFPIRLKSFVLAIDYL